MILATHYHPFVMGKQLPSEAPARKSFSLFCHKVSGTFRLSPGPGCRDFGSALRWDFRLQILEFTLKSVGTVRREIYAEFRPMTSEAEVLKSAIRNLESEISL